MNRSAFLNGAYPSSVSPEMIDAMMQRQASNEAHAKAAEPGLVDVSAFIMPRAIYGSMFKNPITGPTAKRLLVEPPVFKAGRKAQSKMLTRGSVVGSGAALGSEVY